MNDRLDPMTALDLAAKNLARADEIIDNFTSSDARLRRADLSVQVAHGYLRYVELTTVRDKA